MGMHESNSTPQLSTSHLSPQHKMSRLFLQNDVTRIRQPSKEFMALRRELVGTPPLERADDSWEAFQRRFEEFADERSSQLRRMETENTELRNLVRLQRDNMAVAEQTPTNSLSGAYSGSFGHGLASGGDDFSFLSSSPITTFQKKKKKEKKGTGDSTGIYGGSFARHGTDIHFRRRDNPSVASCLNPVERNEQSRWKKKQYEKKWIVQKKRGQMQDDFLEATNMAPAIPSLKTPPSRIVKGKNTNSPSEDSPFHGREYESSPFVYSPIQTDEKLEPAKPVYSNAAALASPDPIPIRGPSLMSKFGHHQQNPRGFKRMGADYSANTFFASREMLSQVY